MDPDQLRLILLGLGILLVAGIYLRDRMARRRSREPRTQAHRVERREPQSIAMHDGDGADGNATPAAPDAGRAAPYIGDLPDADPGRDPVAQEVADVPGEGEERAADMPRPGPEPASGGGMPAADAPQLPEVHHTAEAPSAETSAVAGDWNTTAFDRDPQFTLDLNFSAHGDSDYLSIDPDLYDEIPRMIVQINLFAGRGKMFSGTAIARAAAEVDLQAGDMDIYHRHAGRGDPQVLFSMASSVEPGNFPFDAMQEFATPGLTLFTQLPGVRDGLAIYSDMLFTAQRLAVLLGGRLQDETHSTLSKQAIEHTREQILEHRRQLQLLRHRKKK